MCAPSDESAITPFGVPELCAVDYSSLNVALDCAWKVYTRSPLEKPRLSHSDHGPIHPPDGPPSEYNLECTGIDHFELYHSISPPFNTDLAGEKVKLTMGRFQDHDRHE